MQKITSINNSIKLQFVMQMNTIGLSIIFQEFRTANWFYDTPKYKPQKTVLKNASESLAFIQGTGLEMVLNMYGLMYDATKLRNVFFSMVGDHAKVSD